MTDTPKGRFAVRIMKAGRSKNGNFYPDQTLREAVALFSGARVFVKSDAEHLAAKGKDVRNLIGRIVNPRFTAGPASDSGELSGELELLDPSDPIGRKLLSAHDRGMNDLFGLSIDAGGKVKPAPPGKGRNIVEAIDTVHSVDLIVDPSAGGAVINLIEALEGGSMAKMKPADVTARINKSNLPDIAKARVAAMFDGQEEVEEARLTEAIAFEGDYLGKFTDSGKVKGLGDLGTVEVTDSQEDKNARMLEAVMDPNDRSALSIRDAYVAITGDKHFTGEYPRRSRLMEASSTDFPVLLGGVIEKRVLAVYNQQTLFSLWRKLANIVPATDFRERKAVTIGGFGDLPKVAERGAYVDLGDITENPEAYKVEKRGGTADVTLEMIVNDNVAMIQQIPQKLGIAAQRTISKFVFDLLRTNPQLSDGVTAFHADRGNLGTAALAKASLAAGRLAMKHQTERDSGERLGIPPRYLVVPDELEETAFDLFKRGADNDLKFIETLALEVIPVWYWTDAQDWLLAADPLLMPSLEIGFLRGQQEPEIFIQDQPTAGSMFTNDTVTYKVRHIYGGCIADPRGLYKSVVA